MPVPGYVIDGLNKNASPVLTPCATDLRQLFSSAKKNALSQPALGKDVHCPHTTSLFQENDDFVILEAGVNHTFLGLSRERMSLLCPLLVILNEGPVPTNKGGA